MANHGPDDSDPFADHAAIDDERDTIIESTLSVGRNATLTLGTDSVIVLGWSLSYLASKRRSADSFSSQMRAFMKVRAFRALGCGLKVCRPHHHLVSECSD